MIYLSKKILFYRRDIKIFILFYSLSKQQNISENVLHCTTKLRRITIFFSRQSSSIRLDGYGKAGRVARFTRWWWTSTSVFVPKLRRSRRRRCYSTIYGRIFDFTIGGLTGTTSVKFSLCWMWSVSDTIFFLDDFIDTWQITFYFHKFYFVIVFQLHFTKFYISYKLYYKRSWKFLKKIFILFVNYILWNRIIIYLMYFCVSSSKDT